MLQLYAIQWFNQHLKGENPLIETAAKDFFKPEELKVFDKLPTDQINARIQETFVPQATPPKPPASKAEWESQRDKWMTELREKSFHGWPSSDNNVDGKVKRASSTDVHVPGATVTKYQFVSQDNVELPLYIVAPETVPRKRLTGITVVPLGDDGWSKFVSGKKVGVNTRDPSHSALAYVAPRGIGPTAWTTDPTRRVHIRRRFMLLGQTLDGMRVWDVRRAIQTIRGIKGFENLPLSVAASGELTGVALYAALFEPNISTVELRGLSTSHRDGPYFLNVLRFLDIPQTVAMVGERSHVFLHQDNEADWQYPLAAADKLGWKNRIEIQSSSVAGQPSASER